MLPVKKNMPIIWNKRMVCFQAVSRVPWSLRKQNHCPINWMCFVSRHNEMMWNLIDILHSCLSTHKSTELACITFDKNRLGRFYYIFHKCSSTWWLYKGCHGLMRCKDDTIYILKLCHTCGHYSGFILCLSESFDTVLHKDTYIYDNPATLVWNENYIFQYEKSAKDFGYFHAKFILRKILPFSCFYIEEKVCNWNPSSSRETGIYWTHIHNTMVPSGN